MVDDELRVPEDAGEYHEALARILQRIPQEWGRRISVSAGWYPIIVELDQQVSAIDPGYKLAQIKEKFGGLRVYFETIDPNLQEQARQLVKAAEKRAARTCELCGQPGTPHVRKSGWLRTLCPACAEAGGFSPTRRGEQ